MKTLFLLVLTIFMYGCSKSAEATKPDQVKNSGVDFNEVKKMIDAGSTTTALQALAKLIESDPNNSEFRLFRAIEFKKSGE